MIGVSVIKDTTRYVPMCMTKIVQSNVVCYIIQAILIDCQMVKCGPMRTVVHLIKHGNYSINI